MSVFKSPFVPLHTHSHYSLLEGVDGPRALLERAAACGYGSLALTDSNSLAGAVAFTEEARRLGIRPILGASLRQGRHRCTALIAEPAGYRGLCRVITRLNLRRDAVLVDLLAEQHEGLHLLVQDAELLRLLAPAYGSRLWAEVVRPTASPEREQALLTEALRRGVQPVASTAAHFATDAGYPTFRLLTAIRRNTLLDQLPAQLGVAAGHHLVDPDVVGWRFRDLPEAVINTRRLADQCRSDVLPRGTILPTVHLPPGEDPYHHLRALCERGLRERPQHDADRARARLAEELAIVRQRDLASYFLVVHDITREVRRRRLGMALRGSAGNSLVCYLLGITDIDPIRFGLPLARFLHPGRVDLPDIDLDFDWKVRDRVIDWVFRRYGPGHTAMVSMHLTMQPRSAFREAARAHGLSGPQITRLVDQLPGEGAEAHTGGRVPQAFPLEPERWPLLLEDARRLLGRPRNFSVHPGGVVLTPGPMEQYAPLQRSPKGVFITQFEKDAVEQVGLVKIDLLGNRALATVDEARRLMRQKEDVAILDFSEDDPATVAMLCAGDTLGVNHLESPAMRHLLRQMQPRGCRDVIRAVALIEPGAAALDGKQTFVRRHRGLEPDRHFHPALEPVLGENHGLVIYEDDILGVTEALTRLSAHEADRFRKQILKCQDPAELAALEATFLSACVDNNVGRSVAREVWQQLAKLRQYAFCKSHAVSYGLLGWEAAYLKAHHPLCFWAAALNNNDGQYSRRTYVEAIKRSGIPLHLPCVNRSEAAFTVEGDGLRAGLGNVASLPGAVVAQTLASRAGQGWFASLDDFRRRVRVGPEALAMLIEVGAFDFTGVPRTTLLLQASLPLPDARERRLFRSSPATEVADWRPEDLSLLKRWHLEWQRLGFLVGPPLMELFRPQLPRDLNDSRDLPGRVGRPVRLAGLVATSRHYATRQGRPLLFVTLEDEWGLFEVNLFPEGAPPGRLGVGPYVVEGTVRDAYGALAVTASRLDPVGGFPTGHRSPGCFSSPSSVYFLF